MISDQVRRGIKIACVTDDTNITKAAFDAGVPKSSIYRFMSGSNDIYMTKLDRFCRLGLSRTLEEILRIGRTSLHGGQE